MGLAFSYFNSSKLSLSLPSLISISHVPPSIHPSFPPSTPLSLSLSLYPSLRPDPHSVPSPVPPLRLSRTDAFHGQVDGIVDEEAHGSIWNDPFNRLQVIDRDLGEVRGGGRADELVLEAHSHQVVPWERRVIAIVIAIVVAIVICQVWKMFQEDVSGRCFRKGVSGRCLGVSVKGIMMVWKGLFPVKL